MPKKNVARKPRWATRDECLRERRAVAYAEARCNTTWPDIVRVGLRSAGEASSEGAEAPRDLEACRAALADAGAKLVGPLSEFRALLAKLNGLEGRREPHAADGVLETAIGLVRLHASFARLALDGKGTLERRGRPRVPARGRVASRFAHGWRDPIDGETWEPTARDLALLAICEGVDELPAGWARMTIAELIDAEERAMRPYLTGKK